MKNLELLKLDRVEIIIINDQQRLTSLWSKP